MQTINVIGAGRVGRTLAHLWTVHHVLRVQSILNRTLASGQQAADFVGSGQAVDRYAALGPADLVMISTVDESIEGCCQRLAGCDWLGEEVVVFHCSGSLPSTLLAPAEVQGARIASVHPIKSFADPSVAVETFRGTFCAIEGGRAACDLLRQLFQQLGAVLVNVDPAKKSVYHAATVFASNYLIALMEVSYRCFHQAGMSRDTATQLIRPIVLGTIDNLLRLGPDQALTGPIARGELSVIAQQCEALSQVDPVIQRLYHQLGLVAVELSESQGRADPEVLAAIRCRLEML